MLITRTRAPTLAQQVQRINEEQLRLGLPVLNLISASLSEEALDQNEAAFKERRLNRVRQQLTQLHEEKREAAAKGREDKARIRSDARAVGKARRVSRPTKAKSKALFRLAPNVKTTGQSPRVQAVIKCLTAIGAQKRWVSDAEVLAELPKHSAAVTKQTPEKFWTDFRSYLANQKIIERSDWNERS